MRWFGQLKPELSTAALTRSRDSVTETSGSPVKVRPGRPADRSASISTRRPETPVRATDQVRASAIRRLRAGDGPGPGPGRGAAR